MVFSEKGGVIDFSVNRSDLSHSLQKGVADEHRAPAATQNRPVMATSKPATRIGSFMG